MSRIMDDPIKVKAFIKRKHAPHAPKEAIHIVSRKVSRKTLSVGYGSRDGSTYTNMNVEIITVHHHLNRTPTSTTYQACPFPKKTKITKSSKDSSGLASCRVARYRRHETTKGSVDQQSQSKR